MTETQELRKRVTVLEAALRAAIDQLAAAQAAADAGLDMLGEVLTSE
jgi:outer membrane protein TolC